MKNLKVWATAALMAVSASASAQFVNSGGGSKTTVNSEGWNSLMLEWNPSSFSPKHGDSESFTGLSLVYNNANGLTSSVPLFLEWGIGAQYSFASDFMDIDDITFSMLSAKVPFSLIYKFDIPNSTISLMPNAGLDFRFNIFAKLSNDDDSANLFDKDDMEGSSNTWNRFQVGWHIGLKARFGESFMLGAAYGSDFSEISDDVHIHTPSISLGFTF